MRSTDLHLPSNSAFFAPLLDDEFDNLAATHAAPPQLPNLVMSTRSDVAEWFE